MQPLFLKPKTTLPARCALKRAKVCFSGLFLVGGLLFGCDEPPPSGPDLGDMRPVAMDLKQVCDGAHHPATDMRSQGGGRTIRPGEIGSPCTKDTDCQQGNGQRVCFKTNLLNDDKGAATPGGYCSAMCGGDADCGPQNYCLSFPPSGVSYCVAGCNDAATCRKTDYLCMFLDTVSACLPRFKSMTCNPTDGNPCSTVITIPDKQPGGCVRQAYEDDRSGICYPTCGIGAECPQDSSGASLTCRFLSSFPTGDSFSGNLCLPKPSALPKPDGATCLFADECQAGLQCDLPYVTDGQPTRKCRKLCDLSSAASDCPSGQACRNVFGTCSGAGLCRPL
ncbi:MAG TPA: hypothetical protein PKE31_08625 [Pseudomonadota bacterium]|nr:hypothetical protein [Pseudomonadota bacterium]